MTARNPGPRTIATASVGLVVCLLGVSCSGAIGLLMDTPREQIGLFGLFSAMIAIPLSLAILFLSTALTSVHYGRMWVFGVSLITAIGGASLMAVGFGAETNAVQGLVAGVLFYGLPIALSAIGLAYNAAIGIPAARAEDHNALLDALASHIADDGHGTFQSVAAALDTDRAKLVQLAAEVRRTGRAPLEYDLHRGLLWSRTWFDDQCSALQRELGAQGKIEIASFAQAREVPIELVREWVYTLVYRREISGYVSWKEGILYSADASALRGSSRCPACAGQRELVASGVIQCQHCDAQTLLT